MVWPSEHRNIAKVDTANAANKAPEPPKPFKELLRSYWRTYCEKSTIHGVRYLYDPTLRYIERLIWSALVITSVTLTCIAYLMLANRYNSQKLQTVVESSQYPVFPIPFPAVGVCTVNRINWSRFDEAKERFLPKQPDAALVEVFTKFVERMESLSFGRFGSFAEMEDVHLEALDGVDIDELASFLALTCEDIFYNGTCYWRRVQFDCCDNFLMERTEAGFCLLFNSELSPASQLLQEREGPAYYPLHNSKAGQGTGLNFFLHLNAPFKRPNSLLDDSVSIMIKKSDEWTGESYTITPNTESYVIVRPEFTRTDDSTRNMNPTDRYCLFPDEADDPAYRVLTTRGVNLQYRQTNCLNLCHEDHLIRYCNCSLTIFFPGKPTVRACKAADFRCLAKNNEIFSYDKRQEEDAYFSLAKPGMTCFCLVSCSTLQYFTSLTTLPLSEDIEFLSNSTNVKIFKVDVHYQADVLVRYRTSLEFTSIDLIANFGGIFGLCLGASMVSAVELLYYLTFGFGLYLHDNRFFDGMRGQLTAFWQRLIRRHSLQLSGNDAAAAAADHDVSRRRIQPPPQWQRRQQRVTPHAAAAVW